MKIWLIFYVVGMWMEWVKFYGCEPKLEMAIYLWPFFLLKSAFCPYWEPLYWCGYNLESVTSFRYIPCIPDLTFSVDNVRTTSITSHLESFLISSSGTPFCLKKSNCNYLVLCYKNCSDILWEKIVLVIEKNFWSLRLKAKNLQTFWDH